MNPTHKTAVYNYLEKYKIQHATLGYKYLTTALILCLQQPDYCFKTCTLYIVVAKKHSPATASQVERAIRHALSKQPSMVKNSEFIARAIDEINMDIQTENTPEEATR